MSSVRQSKYATLLTVPILSLWSSWCVALEVSPLGYVKPIFVAQQIDTGGVVDHGHEAQINARMMVDFFSFKGWGEHWRARLHYEIEYEQVLDEVLSGLEEKGIFPIDNSVNTLDFRITDIRSPLNKASRKKRVKHNLDRFYLHYRGTRDDLIIGRQAISFGAARVISPLDFFVPNQLQDLNTEYRLGVDSIRWSRALSELGELDIGMVFVDPDSASSHFGFARTKWSWNGYGIEVLVIDNHRHRVTGLGLQTSLGGVGFWSELSVENVDEKFENSQIHANNNSYSRFSTGLDYGFNEAVYGLLEYHFNGIGERSVMNYDSLSRLSVYQSGSVYLLGASYLTGVLSWAYSPLINASTQVMTNLNDRSCLVSINVRYSITNESDLNSGFYYGIGDGITMTESDSPVLKSEFGAYPRLWYMTISYYF